MIEAPSGAITVTAAVLDAPHGTPRPTEVDLRAPGPGELLVRIMASGVCPTDLHAIDGGIGDVFPVVLGHEGAGIVEAVGDGVTTVRPGDHVVLGFDSCGSCPSCASGHPAYCRRFLALNFAGRTDVATVRATGESVRTGWMAQSAWATHVLATERSVAVVDDGLPWDVAAALGCGVLTGAGTVLNVLSPGPDATVLIIGAGTTGLAALLAARHRDAARVVVCEVSEERRQLALELGASDAVGPDEVTAAMAGSGRRATHGLDTVGTTATIGALIESLAPDGSGATVALRAGRNEVTLAQSTLLWGRALRGVIEGDAVLDRDVRTLVALWRSGRLPVERFVRRYGFDDLPSAIQDLREGMAVKPVLLLDADAVASDPAPAEPGDLLHRLRSGLVPDADLGPLWASLPPVRPEELTGLWHGWAVSQDHRIGRMLTESRWYGKYFASPDDVAPIVVETPEGDLIEDRAIAGGGARLLTIDWDGVVTAAMSYDAMPTIDVFVRVAPDAVLGVMTGRGARDRGRPFYFVLEPAPGRTVVRQDRSTRA